ncbi:MAG: hypothetical protein U0736_27290 [Gemmataceae bacterium]
MWGVLPRIIEAIDFAHPEVAARRQAAELGLAEPGQVILLLSGFGTNEPAITVLTL